MEAEIREFHAYFNTPRMRLRIECKNASIINPPYYTVEVALGASCCTCPRKRKYMKLK